MKKLLSILTASLIMILCAQPVFGFLVSNQIQMKIQQEPLQFTVYPNPVKDNRLFINSKSNAEMHLKIYNILGEKKFETTTKNKIIFLDMLQPGIYILKVEQNQKTGLKRLVIP